MATLQPLKPCRRRGASFGQIVGRVHAQDVEAAVEREAAEAQRKIEAAEQQVADEQARKVAITNATASALTFDVRSVVASVPADWNSSVDEGKLKALGDLADAKAADEALLGAEFEKQVSEFGKRSLEAVPALLDCADSLADASDSAAMLLGGMQAAKASLISALELGRLRRRRDRLRQLIDIASRIQVWGERVASVHAMIQEERFTEAVEALGVRHYSTNGSPLRGNKSLFYSSNAALAGLAHHDDSAVDGATAASSINIKWTPESVEEAGDDVISTIIGAEALRRWLTLSDAENPFILDAVKRASCRAITTPRLLSQFACFHLPQQPVGAAGASNQRLGVEESSAAGDVDLDDEDADAPWRRIASNAAARSAAKDAMLKDNSSMASSSTAGSPVSALGTRGAHSGAGESKPQAPPATKSTGLDWSDEETNDAPPPPTGRPALLLSTSSSASLQPSGSKYGLTTRKSPNVSHTAADMEPLSSLAEGFQQELTDAEKAENAASFDRVLDGLRALQFGPSNLTRFFADTFQLALDFVLLQTLAETLGEDTAETWESIVDTLVPSELHRTVSNVIAGMLALIKNARRLRDHCVQTQQLHEAEVQRNEEDIYQLSYQPPPPPPHGHITGFHTTAVQKCMATLMAFASRVPLGAADVTETLKFFRMLLDFVADCEPLSDDKSPAGTRVALLQVLRSRMDTVFAVMVSNDLGRVLSMEGFAPMQVNPDDFPALHLLLPSQTANRGVADTSSGSVGDILETAPCFTFSSLKTCQRMMELAAAVQGCPLGAAITLGVVVSIGAMYVHYVIVHVGTEAGAPGLHEENANVRPEVRDAAAEVMRWATRYGACPGFPRFTDAPCNNWKPRQYEAPTLFAALERSVALTSVEPVVQCVQMCLKSVSLLLDGGHLDEYTTVAQHFSSLATYCAQSGLRRLATQLCSADSIANTVERIRWDEKTVVGGEGSPLHKHAKDLFSGLHDRLRALITDQGSSRSILRVLLYIVFNFATGLIDGYVKVRKWGDNGRAAYAADVKAIMKFLKASVGAVSVDLIAWPVRFVAAAAANPGSGSIEELFTQYHSLYTEKQLVAAIERETFVRKRELAALLAKMGHVDKVPYKLIEVRQ